MNEISAVTIAICASALICTLVMNFVSDGGTRKIINIVLGVFVICSMIIPVKNLVTGISNSPAEITAPEELTATADEAYSKQIVSQTRANLEFALKDLLLQNNIEISSCEIILSLTDEKSIIISSISIYINQEYTQYADTIDEIVFQNFSVHPNIYNQTE